MVCISLWVFKNNGDDLVSLAFWNANNCGRFNDLCLTIHFVCVVLFRSVKILHCRANECFEITSLNYLKCLCWWKGEYITADCQNRNSVCRKCSLDFFFVRESLDTKNMWNKNNEKFENSNIKMVQLSEFGHDVDLEMSRQIKKIRNICQLKYFALTKSKFR